MSQIARSSGLGTSNKASLPCPLSYNIISPAIPPPGSPPPLAEWGSFPLEHHRLMGLIHRRQREADNPVKPSHRKTAAGLERDVLYAESEFGREQLGFLTVICRAGLSWEDAMERLKSVWQLLQELFVGAIRVIDMTKRGRFHFHFLVIAKGDIATGFNWPAYMEMRALSSRRRLTPEEHQRRRQLGRQLTTNRLLKSLWSQLRPALERAKLTPRFELAPIRVSACAAARYLKGAYYRAVPDRRRPRRGRVFARHGDFPHVPPPVSTPGKELYQRRKAAVMDALATSEEVMAEEYGKRWQFRCLMGPRGLFDYLSAFSGDDPAGWAPETIRCFAIQLFGFIPPDCRSHLGRREENAHT